MIDLQELKTHALAQAEIQHNRGEVADAVQWQNIAHAADRLIALAQRRAKPQGGVA